MPSDTWTLDTPMPDMLDRVRGRAAERRRRRRSRNRVVAVATMTAAIAAALTVSVDPTASSSHLRTTPAERGGTPEASEAATGDGVGTGIPPTRGTDPVVPGATSETGGKRGVGGADAGGRGSDVVASAPTVPKMPTTTAPAPSRPVSGEMEIAFNRGYRVWLMNADGSGAAPLTDASRRVNDPDWSPDGRRLVALDWHLDATGMGVGHLTLVDLDGSLHPLTEEGGFGRPEWSPDGRHIAYLMDVSPGWSAPENDLWVMNADGTGRRRLAEKVGLSYSWSPEGRRIAYEGCGGICTVNVDGTARRLIPGTEGDRDPAWSSDGRLAINTHDEGEGSHWKVAVVNADGTGRRILAEGWFTHEMDWSPDGRTLVYSAQVDAKDGGATPSCQENCAKPEGSRIWRVDADGSDRVAITEGDSGASRPSWRPRR